MQPRCSRRYLGCTEHMRRDGPADLAGGGVQTDETAQELSDTPNRWPVGYQLIRPAKSAQLTDIMASRAEFA
jgi:hypothetical protein